MAENPIHNPNDPNHSLTRRREERLLQENLGQMSDITTNYLETWQKVFATQASIANYWADTFNGIQNHMGSLIQTTQKTLDQARRA